MLGAQARLPRSEAKERLATVEAARAVAACLTPGMPPVEHVSILPRGEYMARIIYQPQARRFPALWWGQKQWTQRLNAACSIYQPPMQCLPLCCAGSWFQRNGQLVCMPCTCLLPMEHIPLTKQQPCGGHYILGTGAALAMRFQPKSCLSL